MRGLGPAFLALLLQAGTARAAETASFLKLTPGARAVGLGDAFTGAADDLSALHFNPAGLAQLSSREAGFTHAELFQGARFNALSYAHPSGRGTWAAGLLHLAQDGIEGRDSNRNPTGSFGASDTAVQLGYSRGIGGRSVMAGLSVKYIESRLADASARTVAFDLGYLQRVSGPLSLGAAVLNLGPGMRYLDETQSLPLSVAFGAGLRLIGAMLLTADYRQRPETGKSSISVGTEYTVFSSLALRGGYLSRMQSPSAGGGSALGTQGLGMGFGVKMRRGSLDYSFSPYGELGHAQRISLSSRF